MGSYQRFPKCNAASGAAIRRDREWREADLRRAMSRTTRLPSPAERIDASKGFRIRIDVSELAELPFASAPQPTRH
jgi:hypothetical protein